jgi:hypothetical protein
MAAGCELRGRKRKASATVGGLLVTVIIVLGI